MCTRTIKKGNVSTLHLSMEIDRTLPTYNEIHIHFASFIFLGGIGQYVITAHVADQYCCISSVILYILPRSESEHRNENDTFMLSDILQMS